MLNYIWGFMIIVGILFGALNGPIPDITDAALWVGLMEIAKNTGLISSITKKIQPFIDFMFPNIPKGHIAREHISTNIIANVLGLGWAATPAGLKAMEALQELNKGRKTASTEMCTFLIINISSLQLIPVNVIAYRSQYGSVNPVGIVGPALLATICSTLAGILFAKIMAVKK